MQPVLRWGSGSAPAPVPVIRIHSQKATEDRPEHVCFLGDLDHTNTHYLPENRERKGRSVPCEHIEDEEGRVVRGCPHCAAGIVVRPNWYAPALIHTPGDVVGGRELWWRVAYYVPHESITSVKSATAQRGKMFACWRKQVGGALRFKSRYIGYASFLNEPSFDAKLVVEHFWFPTPTTAERMKSLLSTLPRVISGPTNRRTEEEQLSAEEVKAARKLLQDHKAKERLALSTSEADLLGKTTGEIISGELNDQLPDGHPAKKHGPKRKGGAA